MAETTVVVAMRKARRLIRQMQEAVPQLTHQITHPVKIMERLQVLNELWTFSKKTDWYNLQQ